MTDTPLDLGLDQVNLVNALEHIRVAAALHYLGGAFDPEHMRAIANLATEALNGNEIPAMPDPEGLRKDAQAWEALYEEQCVDVEDIR